MMISLEEYRKELENLTLEELSERKQKLEKFINDYENNNLSEQEYSDELSPQTKYKLFKEYLDEVMIEFGLRRHQSEWEGVKVFESQCANCKNYLEDINCKIYGEISFDILGNKKVCPNRKNINSNKVLNKYKGCLIGGAIGDALGYPIEFNRSIESIRSKYGKTGITRFDLQDGKARISDDTQMTLFTANGLIWENTRKHLKGISPNPVDCIYMAYKNWHNTQLRKEYRDNSSNICWIYNLPELNVERAPGLTCMEALSGSNRGTFKNPLNDSKGCGGVMRISPCGLYFKPKDIKDYDTFDSVGRLAAEASVLTHGHPLGYIPSYVLAIIINILAYDNYISIEEALDIAMKVYKKRFNIADRKTNKYFIELMEKTKKLAKQNFDDVDSIYELGEGWVAEEALAIALYSCIKYQNDFEKAIICAVNHGGDSDSTGAIAGNIIGTYLGFDQIPEYYIENLELRDAILELSEDLYTVCSTDEFDKSNDKYWLSKYLYIERDEKLKEKNNLKEDLSENNSFYEKLFELENFKNNIIKNSEIEANKLTILSQNPFVIESCKNLYKALIIVGMYQDPAITNIKELIKDINKTILLLKQFNTLNEVEFDNKLDNIIMDENTLVSLIIILQMSLQKENEKSFNEILKSSFVSENKQ